MIEVIALKDGRAERRQSADGLRELLDTAQAVWVDLESPAEDEVAVLDEVFGFHPLTIEDCMQEKHYVKVDEYGDYVFTVLIAADRVSPEQEDPTLMDLAAFLGERYLVTHHRLPLAAVSGVKRRCDKRAEHMLSRGVDFMFYDLVDLVVDNYFAAVRRFDDRADMLEDQILEHPRREQLAIVNDLKNNISQVRRVILDQRMALRAFARDGRRFVSPEVLPYLESVGDNLDRLSDRIELCRETVASARDLYLAVLANRANEATRVLTGWATLLMPVLLVSGLYGMNVPLPGAGSPLAFWCIVGGTLAAAGGFVGYCRWRRWL